MSGALTAEPVGAADDQGSIPATTDGFPGRPRVIARKGQGKMDRDDPAYRGQGGYRPFVLAIYDPFVLGFTRSSGLSTGKATSTTSEIPPTGSAKSGGVVPDGGGRCDRIGRTLHGHRPTPGRVTERSATSPARWDPLKGATSDRPRSPSL